MITRCCVCDKIIREDNRACNGVSHGYCLLCDLKERWKYGGIKMVLRGLWWSLIDFIKGE